MSIWITLWDSIGGNIPGVPRWLERRIIASRAAAILTRIAEIP